jgi:hypothetical protein
MHRVLGVVLVLPLLLWTVTGLVFLVKPGWSGAYEALSAFDERPVDLGGLVPPARLGEPQATRIDLVSTAIGPVYRMTLPGGETRIVEASSGVALSPLTPQAGERIALDAASRASARERYGTVKAVREEASAIAVDFEGGATVSVGRTDLALSQSGSDTALIDALYRMHYLQWTGVAALDRTLELAAIGGTWGLAALGLLLLRRPRGV